MDTSHVSPPRIGRRKLVAGTGAAAVAGTLGVASVPRAASAHSRGRALPAPNPIPGGVDAPPVGRIHWFLPGPTDATTPVIGLSGAGLDVEPSTMTDFHGFTAFAVVAGRAKGSDRKTYDVELDVRVMEGKYVAKDGSLRHGAFGFI